MSTVLNSVLACCCLRMVTACLFLGGSHPDHLCSCPGDKTRIVPKPRWGEKLEKQEESD